MYNVRIMKTLKMGLSAAVGANYLCILHDSIMKIVLLLPKVMIYLPTWNRSTYHFLFFYFIQSLSPPIYHVHLKRNNKRMDICMYINGGTVLLEISTYNTTLFCYYMNGGESCH